MKHNYLSIRKFLLFLLLLVSPFVALAQERTVSGTVIDLDEGIPLPGVNVVEKGTSNGTVTDLDGNYKLTISDGATIVFSYIGYTSEEEVVGARSIIDVSMVLDITSLSEVVVIGYGTQIKKDLSKSISKVDGEDIAINPTSTFESSLQGRAAGVQITTDNGLAGSPVTIRVRGTGSITSSTQPLYVIDGIPITTGSFGDGGGFGGLQTNALADLNPREIEDITILKDAAAQAIYGARGSNGVVIITTKRGKEGKAKVDVGYYAGISEATHRLPLVSGSEWITLAQEAWENAGNTGRVPLPQNISHDNFANTDWQDQVLRTGVVQESNASVSGGTENTKYYLGATFRDEEGYQVGNRFRRGNLRFNIDQKLGDRVKLGTSVGLVRSNFNRVPAGPGEAGLGKAWSNALPIFPVRYPDGRYFAPRSGNNVVAYQESTDFDLNTFRLIGTVYGELEIIPGLKFREEVGGDVLDSREFNHKEAVTFANASSTDRRVNIENWTSNSTLTYTTTLAEKHSIEALIGTSTQMFRQTDVTASGFGFLNPEFILPGSAPIANRSLGTFRTSYSFVSQFARLNYKFNDKYLFTASLRRDGSSRFGPGERFGVFPAFSAGWIISDENFFSSSKISFLKLRGSWGRSGTSEFTLGQDPNFPYLGFFSPTGDYGGVGGITPSTLANPNLTWENSRQIDISLDYALFDDRISGTLSYYNKRSTELLLQTTAPQTSGFSSVNRNIGELSNQGVEFLITTVNVAGADFKWSTDFNFAWNKNEVIALDGISEQLSATALGGNFGNNYAIVGQPIGTWLLAEWAGVNPATGNEMVYTPTGEIIEVTSSNDVDANQVAVGNPYPDLVGGLNNTVSYKNFTVNFLFSFMFGHQVYLDDGKFLLGGNFLDGWNQLEDIKRRWQQPGDVTDVPRLVYGSDNRNFNTTRFLHDADFVRLKSARISYDIPGSITDRWNITAARVFLNGTNLLIFTKFPRDPEVNRDVARTNNVSQGTTYLAPPQARTITAGISLTF